MFSWEVSIYESRSGNYDNVLSSNCGQNKMDVFGKVMFILSFSLTERIQAVLVLMQHNEE